MVSKLPSCCGQTMQFSSNQNKREGCSKCKVRIHDMLRRNWSQHNNKCKSQMGQDQVSGGLSVLCWLAAPVPMFYGNLPKFGYNVKISFKVKLGNMFTNWCNVLSIEGITVCGHVLECHVTWERETSCSADRTIRN